MQGNRQFEAFNLGQIKSCLHEKHTSGYAGLTASRRMDGRTYPRSVMTKKKIEARVAVTRHAPVLSLGQRTGRMRPLCSAWGVESRNAQACIQSV
jgi:hypothetical protein